MWIGFIIMIIVAILWLAVFAYKEEYRKAYDSLIEAGTSKRKARILALCSLFLFSI